MRVLSCPTNLADEANEPCMKISISGSCPRLAGDCAKLTCILPVHISNEHNSSRNRPPKHQSNVLVELLIDA